MFVFWYWLTLVILDKWPRWIVVVVVLVVETMLSKKEYIVLTIELWLL